MFQQSAANLNFLPDRLHNDTVSKKINSTHVCQDYYNSLGVEISGHFTTSAYPVLRIYSERMAVINQPLYQPSLQAFSAWSIFWCSHYSKEPKSVTTLTNQKSRTVSSWLLIGLICMKL